MTLNPQLHDPTRRGGVGYAATRPLLIFSAMLLLAVTLAGCTQRLVVRTQPTGAIVTVADQDGKLLRSGPSPLATALKFPEGGDAAYRIQIEPTTRQGERFYGHQQPLTTDQYYGLALDDDGQSRVLAVTLREKDYVNIPVVEVLLTPAGRWVGVATRSRSFKEVGESGGMLPTLIVDFGENRGIQGMALSPEGDRIVYAEAVYDRRLDGPGSLAPPDPPRAADPADAPGTLTTAGNVYQLKGANLRGINIAGGGVQHITTEDFQDVFPSFTPDGDRILFSSNRRGQNLGILGIRASGRSGISDIYVNHRNGILLQPTAARDGTIAFAVVNVDPARGVISDAQVWTNFGPNEFPTQITTEGGREPVVSPDGSKVAYINPRDGNLWVVDTDGATNTQLTFGATEILRRYRGQLTTAEQSALDTTNAVGRGLLAAYRNPSWSPDGRFILYGAMEGVDPEGRPNEDIWIIAADGSEKYQLTTNGSTDRYPLMSPGGEAIYFLSNRGESWGIWRIDYASEDTPPAAAPELGDPRLFSTPGGGGS